MIPLIGGLSCRNEYLLSSTFYEAMLDRVLRHGPFAFATPGQRDKLQAI